MSKLILGTAGAGAVLAGLAVLPAPVAAQAPTQSEVVVFGTDPCPRATDDQIVVCRRLPEAMRYRMPEAYRPGATFQERQSWANKARALQSAGDTGPGSCSAVGPGGYSGCLAQEIERARQAQREAEQQAIPPE